MSIKGVLFVILSLVIFALVCVGVYFTSGVVQDLLGGVLLIVTFFISVLIGALLI